MLTEHHQQLDLLAHALLAHETLDEADAYAAAGIPVRKDQNGGEGARPALGASTPDSSGLQMRSRDRP